MGVERRGERFFVLSHFPVREYLARIGDCAQMVLPFSLRLSRTSRTSFPSFPVHCPSWATVPCPCFEQREKRRRGRADGRLRD